ncbi:hypothetical protein CDAR_383661 [Caerostris darwini]|uniref:Uncharacterized protein n=1 Tax=Caerostris darwini TaxID=1538125 RepID=A0AAV4N9I3_9ARAC|nr:hypothetical protein CDAR_383661 [Caerostris darwini]
MRLNDWCRHREPLTPNTFPRRIEVDCETLNIGSIPEITSRISVPKRSGPESVMIVNFIVDKSAIERLVSPSRTADAKYISEENRSRLRDAKYRINPEITSRISAEKKWAGKYHDRKLHRWQSKQNCIRDAILSSL